MNGWRYLDASVETGGRIFRTKDTSHLSFVPPKAFAFVGFGVVVVDNERLGLVACLSKVDGNLTSGNSNEEGLISALSLRKWSITVEKARTEFLVVEICVWISLDLHGLGSGKGQR